MQNNGAPLNNGLVRKPQSDRCRQLKGMINNANNPKQRQNYVNQYNNLYCSSGGRSRKSRRGGKANGGRSRKSRRGGLKSQRRR